jgi:hypothetical protein
MRKNLITLGLSLLCLSGFSQEAEENKTEAFNHEWKVGVVYSPYLENTTAGTSLLFGNRLFMVGFDYLQGGDETYFGSDISGRVTTTEAHLGTELGYNLGRTTGYQRFLSVTGYVAIIPSKLYFGLNLGQAQQSYYKQFTDFNETFESGSSVRIRDEVKKEFLVGIHAMYIFDFGLTLGAGYIGSIQQFNPRIGYTYTF